jgi:hypothetical protein
MRFKKKYVSSQVKSHWNLSSRENLTYKFRKKVSEIIQMFKEYKIPLNFSNGENSM